LQAAADEEAYLRKLQSDELRRSWEDQIANRPQESKDEPINLVIGNDDPLQKDRTAAQKEQMKRWCREQAHQNAQRKLKERDEDMAYADMLRAIDDIRGAAEEDEAKLRAEMIRKVRDDNLRVWIVVLILTCI
jgi:hypothetical protein